MRYIVKISYDGKNFNGWQKQPNKITVEGVLEQTFSKILGREIDLVASGRTDTGVSAICQIAHFDFEKVIPRGLKGHINSVLPESVRVIDIALAKDSFHARFNAKTKTYKYYFYTGECNIPYYDRFAYYVKYVLNDSTMQTAVKSLIGEHNFASFCSEGSDTISKVRTITNASLNKTGQLYEFTISGNGFLYNMVRIIVGTLIDIGRGKITKTMKQIIESEDRVQAGITAPAKGLVLYNVEY